MRIELPRFASLTPSPDTDSGQLWPGTVLRAKAMGLNAARPSTCRDAHSVRKFSKQNPPS